jgi:ribosomal protein S18 acetylase RimI-like enzyme
VQTQQAAVTRRSVERRDEELLRELFASSRQEWDLLPPDSRDALIAMQFRAQRQQYVMRYPNACNEILVADGVDVGQLIVDQSTTTVRIVDVTVLQAHRGRGIGSTVLGGVIATAERVGLPVQLSVWSTNVGARRLYERLGFAVTGETNGYLDMHRTATQKGK